MTDHQLVLTLDPEASEAPHLALVCTAAPGAPCRKRPPDDRERWSYNDPDLVDGECWAIEWIDAAGWDDSVRTDGGGRWSLPVDVTYDEGVIVTPILDDAQEATQ